MTRLVNDPAEFPTELVDGFVEANQRYVRKVFGGAVRATRSRPGKVALIIGGGTGHYPAFSGWVGPGLVDGVVTGNIFSSPSASQAYSVGKAADHGGGVLIGFGNYAGDVIHFGQAVERLRADGIEARTVIVTDDIASASNGQWKNRRGIAGFLPVFKVTSAAAEDGLEFDDVVRVFDKVNYRTRTLGVAFTGCTLPGSDGPLFTVPEGKMSVGLGVHGEPGVYETDLGTADDVAELLVNGLLEDRPDDAGDRVVVLLNGLGSIKYEELFVTYSSVGRRLRAAGVELIDGQVGEFVTSLDMGGVSLTAVWLEPEIERYWFAACDSPAYHRHELLDAPLPDDVTFATTAPEVVVDAVGHPVSQQASAVIVRALRKVYQAIETNQQLLGDLDSVAGDGDHGIGMTRGSKAAADVAENMVADGAGVQTTLVGAGDRWAESAGGASGALWGAALTAAGSAVGDGDPPADAIVKAAAAVVTAIQRLGSAQRGDKTMLDSIIPFNAVLSRSLEAGNDLAETWAKAAAEARSAAESTADLEPKVGRARVLAARSVGSPDPGATSFAIVAGAVAELLAEESV